MMKYHEHLCRRRACCSCSTGFTDLDGGTRLLPGGRPKVIDGPFAEAKEVIAGYSMIQVKSKGEAIEWAKRCPSRAKTR